MRFMLTRMFAYLTLFVYLLVGSVAVRFLTSEMTTVSLSTSYLSLFQNSVIKTSQVEPLSSPEIKFAEIKFPVENKVLVAKVKVAKPIPKPVQKEVPIRVIQLAKNELPFHEPVVLQRVEMQNELATNLVSIYQDFTYRETAVAAAEDVVSTKLAKNETPKEEDIPEPVFYEYEKDESVATSSPAPMAVEEKVTETKVETKEKVNSAVPVAEEVAVEDLVAFDYSGAQKAIESSAVPVITGVTTQKTPTGPPAMTSPSVHQESVKHASKAPVMGVDKKEKSVSKSLLSTQTFPAQLTIQTVGTDLKKSFPIQGFEIRFQDDLNETLQDYNSGSVSLEEVLAEEKMTRTVSVLKHGFAPTNTDLILEEGAAVASVPLITEEVFNETLAPYEGSGPVGAVLVELDDDTESSTIDVPFARVVHLDGDMKITESDDFRYELFIGVKAGNALLSYKDSHGDVISKIIHVHDREVSYESNFFESVKDEKIQLFEEDLLSKEKMPLIISSTAVKQFATNKTAKKVDDHTYKMSFGRTLLGGRRYLELLHQQEPVFIGVRGAHRVNVPSENFMRFVLSRFEDSRLGNRCLVQVNLSKKALKVDVAPESVDSSLMTYTQILDRDGKFYDTVGDKSEKVIVVGENQTSEETNMDAKINLKITYQDGSVQFLGSYCSPNTYLVEQL